MKIGGISHIAAYRDSKSPDLAGDLPIFDIIMTISRFEMNISRFITRDYLALSIANFAMTVGETIFSLANFVYKSFRQSGERF